MPRASTLLLAATLMLGACADGRDAPPFGGATGTGVPDGAAACSRACNRDYDVCMEAGTARGTDRGALRGMSCDRQFRRCVATCRAAS